MKFKKLSKNDTGPFSIFSKIGLVTEMTQNLSGASI